MACVCPVRPVPPDLFACAAVLSTDHSNSAPRLPTSADDDTAAEQTKPGPDQQVHSDEEVMQQMPPPKPQKPQKPRRPSAAAIRSPQVSLDGGPIKPARPPRPGSGGSVKPSRPGSTAISGPSADDNNPAPSPGTREAQDVMGGKASAQQKAAEEAKQRRAEKKALKAAGQAGAAPTPGPMRPPPEPEPEPEPAAPNAGFLAAQAHIKSTIGGEDHAQVYIDALRTWLRGHGLPSEKAEVLAVAFTNAFGEGTESEWVPTLDSMDEHELEEFMAAALGNAAKEVPPPKVPITMQEEEVVDVKSQSKEEGASDPEAISHVSDALPHQGKGQPIAVPDQQNVTSSEDRFVDGDISVENGRVQSFGEEPPLLSGESDFDSGEDAHATITGETASEGVPPDVHGGRLGVANTGSTTADVESMVSAADAVAKAEAVSAQDEAVAGTVSAERGAEAHQSEQQTLELRNLQERLEQRDASVAQLSQALEHEQVALDELRTVHADVAAQLEQQLLLRAESELQYAELQAEWAKENQARERAEQAYAALTSEVEALRATAASKGSAEAELADVREQLEITRREFAKKESEFEIQVAQLRKNELERLTSLQALQQDELGQKQNNRRDVEADAIAAQTTTESLQIEILELKAALIEANRSRDASHANFLDLSATVELMEQQLAQEQAKRVDVEAAAVEAQAVATRALSAAQLDMQQSEMQAKDSLSAQHEAVIAALKSAHGAQLAAAVEAERRQADEVAAQVDWDRTEAHEGEMSRLRAQLAEDKAKMEEQLAAAEDQLFELEQANDERIADVEHKIAQARAQTAEEQRRVATLQTELSDTRASLEAASSNHIAMMETKSALNRISAQLEQSEQALREEQVRVAAALTQAQEATASKLTAEETLERVQNQ